MLVKSASSDADHCSTMEEKQDRLPTVAAGQSITLNTNAMDANTVWKTVTRRCEV